MYKIFDLHNDYYLKLQSDNSKLKYLKKNDKCLGKLVSAIWTSELSNDEAIYQVEQALHFVNSNKNLLLGIEDLHFLTDSKLDWFLKIKPAYAGLTWNRTNCLAGGAFESGKLTQFGKKTIKLFEDYNIVVDTAHLNEESFMDIAKNSKRPLFCSHTAFFGVQKHQRNLKDYQLKMIVDSGGLVGLCLVSDFINGTKKCSVKDVVSHIDYFACKFGIDNIAIGTDFYGTKHLPSHAKSYDSLLCNISKCLENMGYTQKSIEKIFCNNAQNFFNIA